MKCESEYERMIGESEVLLMSVLVKDMKMPEKCGLCDLYHAEYPIHCSVVKGHKTVGAPYGMPRPEWCPLVELPEKHGDLIDRDALVKDLTNGIKAGLLLDGYEEYPNIINVDDCVECVKYADAVIEAEGENEN